METNSQMIQEKIKQALDLARDLKNSGEALNSAEAKLAVDDLIDTLVDADDFIEEPAKTPVWSVY